MNPVCTFIDFIKNLTDDDYGHNISYFSSKLYFKSGGCYELVKTLKYFLPDSEIYVRNDYGHCTLKYKGILYDIDGIVEDNSIYHLATKEDMLYLNDPQFYGRIEIKFDFKSPSDALIQNILKCRVMSLVDACRKMDSIDDFYKPKQKIKE